MGEKELGLRKEAVCLFWIKTEGRFGPNAASGNLEFVFKGVTNAETDYT